MTENLRHGNRPEQGPGRFLESESPAIRQACGAVWGGICPSHPTTALVLLAALTLAVIPGGVKVRVNATWREHPVLYIAVLGASSSGKSPFLANILFNRIEKIRQWYKQLRKLVEDYNQLARACEIKPLKIPVFMFTTTTAEGLAQATLAAGSILEHLNRSEAQLSAAPPTKRLGHQAAQDEAAAAQQRLGALQIARDAIRKYIGERDLLSTLLVQEEAGGQLSAAGDASAAVRLIAVLNVSWDGRSEVNQRVDLDRCTEEHEVKFSYICGIQPGMLNKIFQHTAIGLPGRFIYLPMPELTETVVRVPASEADQAVKTIELLFERAFNAQIKSIALDEEAAGWVEDLSWRTRYQARHEEGLQNQAAAKLCGRAVRLAAGLRIMDGLMGVGEPIGKDVTIDKFTLQRAYLLIHHFHDLLFTQLALPDTCREPLSEAVSIALTQLQPEKERVVKQSSILAEYNQLIAGSPDMKDLRLNRKSAGRQLEKLGLRRALKGESPGYSNAVYWVVPKDWENNGPEDEDEKPAPDQVNEQDLIKTAVANEWAWRQDLIKQSNGVKPCQQEGAGS